MSKKTRKKSSKAPPAKSARTAAAKPAAAKAARGSKKPATKTKASKAAAKGAAKVGGKKPAQKPTRTPKVAPAKASHKAPSKSLKSNISAPPQEALPKPAPEQPPKKARPPVPEAGLAQGDVEAAKESAREVAKEGAMAPAFQLPRDGGGSVSLADYAGKKLVLFFYPRADTPGCTREAIDFTRLSDAFAAEGTAVLGVSADSVSAQDSFRDKHQLAVPLISDETHGMLEAYGAWGEKSMYGRSFMGIIRTTVLIGSDGRIARIWRNVRVDGHADEVLAAVREA
jgi:thioredoxin-dependent peroxiredoxin